MSETTDGRSRQQRIADAIRNQIESGELQPGDQLPSLVVLAEDHRTSQVTVRYAIDLLKQEGLVVSRQGSGNFVRTALPVRRYGIDRYSRAVWERRDPRPPLVVEAGEQGKHVGQVTEVEQVPAPQFVAERLPDVAEGELVHVRRRVTTLDGVINQSADSYFTIGTAERSPELLTGQGGGGHIARIDAISPVLEVEEEITARMPTGPEKARLELPAGTVVFEVYRTYHTEEGPLDVTRFVIRADMAEFDYRFPIPD